MIKAYSVEVSTYGSLSFFKNNFWPHPEACGILSLPTRIKPAPSALEGRVLTTGPPGKFLQFILNMKKNPAHYSKMSITF